MAVAHYLEALDFQKEIVKIHTIFGGKNPHPNWLVGGVPCAINVDGTGAVGAINMERLNYVSEIIDRTVDVHRPGLPARPDGDRARSTRTGSTAAACRAKCVMSYGDIPEHANDYSDKSLQAAARRDRQRQPQRGLPGRPAQPGGDPGVRRPLLVQVPGRDQGPAPLGRRHRAEFRARAQHQGHAAPTSRRSTRAPSTRASRRRAGRATRWRSARSPAG